MTPADQPNVLFFGLCCIAVFCVYSFPMVIFSWLSHSNRWLTINPCRCDSGGVCVFSTSVWSLKAPGSSNIPIAVRISRDQILASESLFPQKEWGLFREMKQGKWKMSCFPLLALDPILRGSRQPFLYLSSGLSWRIDQECDTEPKLDQAES